ncbi:MAG: TolC family outer membrane protein [Henriciella sp.]
MKLRVILVSAVMASVLPVSAGAESLADALRAAFANNPGLAADSEATTIAMEGLEQANALRRPQLSVSGGAGFESVDSNRPFSFGIGDRPTASAQLEARLPVYAGGGIDARIRQAEAGIQAADKQFESARQNLYLDVVQAYVNVLSDRENVRIRQSSVYLLSEQVRAANDRFDVGVVTRTDVAQSEARYEGAVAALSAAEAALESSEAFYAFLVGSRPGELEAAPLPEALPQTLESALDLALQSNPDLNALRLSEQVASENVTSARAQLKPSVSIVGAAGYQETFDENFRDTSVSAMVQASIPLYQGGATTSRIREAQSQLQQSRLRTQALERQVRAEIARSWFTVLATDRSIEASERQVSAAEIAYEGAQEELAVGVRTTLDVLDQEQQLLEARLGLINARRDSYVARHQLLRAMGRLRVENLEP